jgi:hypothetical protein
MKYEIRFKYDQGSSAKEYNREFEIDSLENPIILEFEDLESVKNNTSFITPQDPSEFRSIFLWGKEYCVGRTETHIEKNKMIFNINVKHVDDYKDDRDIFKEYIYNG